MSFCIPFMIDFWSNLAPTWPQLGTQKSTKNRLKNQSIFWSIFWWIFDRFLADFGSQVGLKIDKKWVRIDFNISLNKKHKTFKNHWFSQCFWSLGLFKMSWKSTKNRSKVDNKSIKKLIHKLIDFLIDFLSIFGRFWVRHRASARERAWWSSGLLPLLPLPWSWSLSFSFGFFGFWILLKDPRPH